MSLREGRSEVVVGGRRAELARPGDGLVWQQAREQVELLLEQVLVIVEVVPEEGERLDQRAAAGDQLGPAIRHRVEGGKLGVHPNGVLRAQDGDGSSEPNAFGSPGDRGQDDARGRVHHVLAVVLGDVERVDPDGICEYRLFDGVADDDVAAQLATRFVYADRHERGQSELYVLEANHLATTSTPTAQFIADPSISRPRPHALPY